jgi:hypothetical protein
MRYVRHLAQGVLKRDKLVSGCPRFHPGGAKALLSRPVSDAAARKLGQGLLESPKIPKQVSHRWFAVYAVLARLQLSLLSPNSFGPGMLLSAEFSGR